MARDELIARVVGAAEADLRVLALLLAGSLGRGEADPFSDVDLIAVVAPPDHAAFSGAALEWLAAFADVVHAYAPHPGVPLACIVTADWLRLDLTTTVPGRVPGAQSTTRPLLDRAGVWDGLAPSLPPRPADPARVAAIVTEFIRVLGLLPVAIGRDEPALAQSGYGLLRGQLIALMVDERDLPAPVGALKLRGVIPEADRALLAQAPAPRADWDELIEASRWMAGIFVPRARARLTAIGGAFPERFWSATRERLERGLGGDWGET